MKPTPSPSSRRAGPRVALAAALIALAAAGAAIAQPAMGPHGGPGGPGAPMMQGRMLERIGASAEQKSRIEAIHRAAYDDLKKLREDGRALHEQMAAALAAPTIDTAQLESLRQKQLAQHDLASQRMLKAMVDAANVLTPEQRRQMAERMKQRREMMERHRRERDALDAPSTR